MHQAETIRVVVVDDHPLLRDGLCSTFALEPDFLLVGEGSGCDDALRLAREASPSVILLDVNMPGGGIRAAQAIKDTCPGVKVVMLTVSETGKDVMSALQSGAAGYILKGISGSDLAEIVREIHRGRPYVSPSLAARMLASLEEDAAARLAADPLGELTFRERQILDRLAEGLSNREIGEQLNIREKTVKHYVTGIFQKLQVRNRVEAAMLVKARAPSGEPAVLS